MDSLCNTIGSEKDEQERVGAIRSIPQEQKSVVRPDLIICHDIAYLNPNILDILENRITPLCPSYQPSPISISSREHTREGLLSDWPEI